MYLYTYTDQALGINIDHTQDYVSFSLQMELQNCFPGLYEYAARRFPGIPMCHLIVEVNYAALPSTPSNTFVGVRSPVLSVLKKSPLREHDDISHVFDLTRMGLPSQVYDIGQQISLIVVSKAVLG